MQKRNILIYTFLLFFVAGLNWSCQKKSNFIDEDKLGAGIHYYPDILNELYYDTIAHKYFSDTTFTSGQNIVFKLYYTSQDSISQIELWISQTGKKTQKAWETAYSPSFYSEYQLCDTTFISFALPEDLDSTTQTLILHPKVITQQGLITQSSIELQIAQ